MWLSHWNLTADPFRAGAVSYVAVPTHDEVVARLTYLVESGERLIELRADGGLGKTAILREMLRRTRGATRRSALVESPTDGESLVRGLSEGLGLPWYEEPSERSWGRLAQACRTARSIGQAIVLVLDDDSMMGEGWGRRLAALDPHPERRITVIVAGREREDEESGDGGCWLTLRLPSLTRSETERYVSGRLRAVGRRDPVFTPRSLAALHARTGGVPVQVDRVARLSLLAGAARRVEVVTPDLLEAAVEECAGLPDRPRRLF